MNSDEYIAIMVCTRQRPEMLKKCLISIIEQIEIKQFQDFLVVVENDTSDGSRQVVEDLKARFPSVGMYYLLETDLGIPIARQTGVDFALERGAHWLAFIDDDEELEGGWLERMRSAAKEFNCDVITGPVRYDYPDKLPVWFKSPKNKNRPRGTNLKTAATNNTLLSAEWYQSHRDLIRFDPQFRFTGGSDTDFFYRLTDLGGVIKWVDDAFVKEKVPYTRLTLDWQLQRARRTAANASQIAIKRKGPAYASRRYLPKSLMRLFCGILLLILAGCVLPFSRDKFKILWFKGRKAISSGLGSIQGMLGASPQPYKTITGQ